jgi:hypothetical protein
MIWLSVMLVECLPLPSDQSVTWSNSSDRRSPGAGSENTHAGERDAMSALIAAQLKPSMRRFTRIGARRRDSGVSAPSE